MLRQAEEGAASFATDGRAERVQVSTWATQQWVAFLDALPRSMPLDRLASLDRAFHLSDRTNSEILFSWLRLAIAHHYDPAVPAIERFLAAQGRRKFVQPLFEALVSDDWGRPIAKRIYGQVREGYHPVTVAALDRLLGQ